jgi:hypothetical protein
VEYQSREHCGQCSRKSGLNSQTHPTTVAALFKKEVSLLFPVAVSFQCHAELDWIHVIAGKGGLAQRSGEA